MRPMILFGLFVGPALERNLLCFGLAALTITSVCCGGGGGLQLKNEVSGKVTLEGKPVAGTLIFVGSDNKESPPVLISPKAGEYRADLAPGDYKVAVRGAVGAVDTGTAPAVGPGGETRPPPATLPGVSGGVGMAASPPAKYASPDNGLTFKHAGGKQTFNVDLKP